MAKLPQQSKLPPFFTLASVAIVIAMLYWAQAVLIPLALAMLLAFLLAPLVSRLERLHLHRVPATLVVAIGVLGAIGGFGWMMERQFVDMAAHFPEYRGSIQSKLQQLLPSDHSVQTVREELKRVVSSATTQSTTAPPAAAVPLDTQFETRPVLPTESPENPMPVRVIPEATSPLVMAFQYITQLGGSLATAAIVGIFVIFILLEREDLRDRFIRLLGQGRLHVTTEALDDAAQRVSHYLIAQSAINLIFGAIIALGVWIINAALGGGRGGLATALLAGLVTAVMRFIPYFGTWIGALLPLSFAFAAFPQNGVFFAILALYVTLEVITSQAIEPQVLGSKTGLSAMAVLVAAVFWTWLWGPIGLLLSTPLTALLVVMGKHVPQLEFLEVMLGDEPPIDPPVRIYQRLIARDEEEAAELAQDFLKTMSLEAVFDAVLVPALAAARRDWRRGSLDDEHFAFVCRAMKEIVQTLCDQPADTQTPPTGSVRPALRDGADVRVACIPAQDESDEIVGLMLQCLLGQRGYKVDCLSATSLTSEIAGLIEGRQAVIVSALPPNGAVHAKYLLKRLKEKCPDMKVVIGLWNQRRHPDKPADSGWGGIDPATTLAQALDQLDQLSHIILIESANNESAEHAEAVGARTD